MPQFSYKARRRSGETVSGVIDVADRSAALAQMERLGLFPIMIDAAGKGGVAVPAAETKSSAKGRNVTDLLPASVRTALQRKRKPKLQELATYTTQLANLLNSGMPLTVALNSMTHLESKGIPADVSIQLKQEVMEGRSLSDAMAQQPRIFSDLYVNMVRAGESSGALVDVLRRFAYLFQQFADVQGIFASAMFYQILVCLVGVGLVLFFIYFMLPHFIEMFQGFNIELPLPTKILIATGFFFSHYWWVLILLVIVGSIVFRRFQTSALGRAKLDKWKMSAPVIGKVVKLNLFAQFAPHAGDAPA